MTKTTRVLLGCAVFWIGLIGVIYTTTRQETAVITVAEVPPVAVEDAINQEDENDEIQLPEGITATPTTGSIVVSGSLWNEANTSLLRKTIIAGLIDQGFQGWSVVPYSGSDANGVITYQGTGFRVWQGPNGGDSLQWRIQEQLMQGNSNMYSTYETISIGSGMWSKRENVQLFQNTQDLIDLGYETISSRRRISTDVEYRRKNIRQSFAKIGNVRVIPPSGDLAFMDAAQYDGRISRVNYEYGYVVVGNQEKMDYAGGICGASSAIYQGIITNGSLETTRVRNHTRWYTDLYAAYIDGELVTTPGIDSAVFDGSLDLEMVNTASHPIIVVMNYDGTLGGVEEVFTLGRPSDRQEIEFVSSYPTSYTGPSGIGTGTVTTRGGCYTWMIGDEEVKRCYRKVQ